MKDRLNSAINLLTGNLVSERTVYGLWTGVLSSSAVSTAVAAFALAKLSPGDKGRAARARRWLACNMNADGGWGDTPESPSNLSATLLVRAALLAGDGQEGADALARSDAWVVKRLGGISPEHIIEGVRNFYGKDLTFSAPLLTVCALSSMFGGDARVWKMIPRLPFGLSVLPHRMYRLLNLPVVSYALPALIAVGVAQFEHDASRGVFARLIGRVLIPRSLKKLESLTPSHGGFLDAAPLTGFVASCLGCSGYGEHPVVKKALGFLRSTMREEGSWPIDTNLSNWVSTLALKALDGGESFSVEERNKASEKLLSYQFKDTHPFTRAKPGGWGWTDLPGSVPDADDTAGTLVALALLGPGRVTEEIEAGVRWLLGLINRDGGVPTFCRGWGLLPFDRSCPDISSHALKAFSLWLPHVESSLQKRMQRAVDGVLRYMESSRDADNAWTPLWFGDQNAQGQTNRVYGTATVLLNLHGQPRAKVAHLVGPACAWLLSARNPDGGWGGEPATPSMFETTAQALAALSVWTADVSMLDISAEFLLGRIAESNGFPAPSSFGLYFSSLWYNERLYPLVFGLRALKLFKEQRESICRAKQLVA